MVHIDDDSILFDRAKMARPQMRAPFQGMVLLASAMMILPGMDAIAKYMAVSGGMAPGQVAFYRFFFQLACTLPLLLSTRGSAAFRAKRPWMNLLRGALHAC